jgi:DeoR/GlpR family transcriptional regulator of sugar metabolism
MDRLRAIMDALTTADSVSVADLAVTHGVSEMTIRRDQEDEQP